MTSKQTKVLLLHPRPTPGDSCTVPYSCLAVAAPLVADGYQVEILDEFSTPNYPDKLLQSAARADVVGISCFTGHQIASAMASATLLRKHDAHLPLVWGGYHPSLYPKETVLHDLVDYVIAGQGEGIFHEFVNRLETGEKGEDTPGLWKAAGDLAVQNPGNGGFTDLENFPRFPYELVRLNAFLIDSLTSRSISYHSSLGCPYRCNFCTVTEIYNRRWSGFIPERVLADVRFLLAETQAHSVEFYDNNFFVNDERVQAIAKGFVDGGFEMLWSAEARPDTIAEYDSDMMSLLARSGLKWVFIGAESGHDGVLELMERDHSADDIVRAAENLAKYNIKVTFSFNLGYPGEAPDNFSKTEALGRELRRINRQTELMVYITTAYDSTPAFHRAQTQESNAKETEVLNDWSHLDQRSGNSKSWLAASYSKKLYNFSLVTFYATSFLHDKFKQLFSRNVFLRLLHLFARLRMRLSWYGGSILELRILNRLFLMSSRKGRRGPTDMWSGRT